MSGSKWSDDSESVRSKYLLLGESLVSCDVQVGMAITSAVESKAMLETWWAIVELSNE